MVKKYYIAKSPYGYTIGEGETKALALEDAYGPKKYWDRNTKRNIRDGWFEEKTKLEADEAVALDANKEPNLPGYYDEELVGGTTGDNNYG
tara:strand:+ start:33 stop:305 length:273 start_codon:yes stop_codon:yes gene_type:complete